MRRIVFRGVVGLLVVVALLYVGDWAVWRTRVAAGGGMGSVVVSTIVVASLKGNKEEYYPQGTQTVACSKSIFPQVGGGACWWLQGHPEVQVHY